MCTCFLVEYFLINYPRRSRGKRGLLSKLSSLTNHSQATNGVNYIAVGKRKCKRFPFLLLKPRYCFTKLPETRPLLTFLAHPFLPFSKRIFGRRIPNPGTQDEFIGRSRRVLRTQLLKIGFSSLSSSLSLSTFLR